MDENKYVQALLSGSAKISTYSWENDNASQQASHTVGMVLNEDGYTPNRMCLQFYMPELPNKPRIHKAVLTFYQKAGVNESETAPLLGLFQEGNHISVGAYTPPTAVVLLDYAPMKATAVDSGVIAYSFDITKMVMQRAGERSISPVLSLQLLDETLECNSNVSIFGCTDPSYAPTICIDYESSYGVDTGYPVHTHEIGRFGQGMIDLALGNLMFQCEDFAWGGNRMPVTIKRVYNSLLCAHPYTGNAYSKLETADFSAMHIGLGWKLNVMQSIMPTTFRHDGTEYNGYVYIGENGDPVYFKRSDTEATAEDGLSYSLYEAIMNPQLRYDPEKGTLALDNSTYQFDVDGRLVSITDEHDNQMTLTYQDGKLTAITDGAGRSFLLSYDSDDQLDTITSPDGSQISYTYSDELLRSVTYPNGCVVRIGYDDYYPWQVTQYGADGAPVCRVEYAHGLKGVTQYGVENGAFVAGASTMYTFNGNNTVAVTTDPAAGDDPEATITTVYSFDYQGNIIGEYAGSQELDNIGIENNGAGVHPYYGGAVDTVNLSKNMLFNHSFENSGYWKLMAGTSGTSVPAVTDEVNAKFGKKMLHMTCSDKTAIAQGMYQVSSAAKGCNTFSMYVRVLSDFTGGNNPGVYIRVTDENNAVLAESEHIAKCDSDYVRLAAPFEVSADQSVNVQILADGAGSAYADAAQLEANPFASAYNMLDNGDCGAFNLGWRCSSDAGIHYDTSFNTPGSLTITGSLHKKHSAFQPVLVRRERSVRETFCLSGWAKGRGMPVHEREGAELPQFRLHAEISYRDTEYGETPSGVFTADFNPCVDDWQHISLQFAKRKYRTVQNITVGCDFSYNYGTVYFDDIQLTRQSLETGLTAEDFTEEDPETVAEEAIAAQSEDTESVSAFEEVTDSFGNSLTETTFTDGEYGTIYRSFGFSENGNDLIRETDARGNSTVYEVIPDTSQVDQVTDRCGNKTAYGYDDAGRNTNIVSKDADDNFLATVSYEYDSLDELTGIVRGDGLKYALQYNAFHELESIGIDGASAPLMTYAYKSGNGRLKQMTYANGDTMKATYNALGQMVAEKWYNAAGTLTAHYRYSYDDQGNIVRSVDIASKKEYSYFYEEGRIVRSVEYDITLDGSDIVISRCSVCELRYSYNVDGDLSRKRVLFASGDEQVTYYETKDGETTAAKFVVNGQTITSHSKTDSFGRKVFDELQLGTDFVSRQFSYHAGQVAEEHKENAKVKSSATTQLVSQIVLSDGRTLSYAYDEEERITAVTESREENGETVISTTEYTYDALGQLLTEKVDGVVVNAMTYDNYGNILTKNGKEYTYGDNVWKDKLTAFDGQAISYDAQGNPTTYLGHTLTWEKGRQLKSFDGNRYTYNANGIRTGKTVNGVAHSYTLDGTNILKETWDGNTLIPLRDNEEQVCGILYNGTPYYFLKNLQGDILAILDANGDTVATYTYDAWGVCTISSDTSGCNIATLNPFRYRGYYFDAEIGMYYLQSRYYDPAVGRFVNSDDTSSICNASTAISKNLYCYCFNNSINGVDNGGNILLSQIAKFLLYAFFGVIAQLASDYIEFLVRKIVQNKNVTFKASAVGDYIGSALSWGMCSFDLFNRKLWCFLAPFLPVILKYATNIICGSSISWYGLLVDLMAAFVAGVISVALNSKMRAKLNNVRRGAGNRYSTYAKYLAKQQRIRIRINKWFLKASFTIVIATGVVQLFLNLLLKK